MSSLAEVKLWGRTIGAVSLDENNNIAAFEYDSAFARSGIEIAPLTMPLSSRVYTFPELPQKTFHGLPGLLADSLPDRFGNFLIVFLPAAILPVGDVEFHEVLFRDGTLLHVVPGELDAP